MQDAFRMSRHRGKQSKHIAAKARGLGEVQAKAQDIVAGAAEERVTSYGTVARLR